MFRVANDTINLIKFTLVIKYAFMWIIGIVHNYNVCCDKENCVNMMNAYKLMVLLMRIINILFVLFYSTLDVIYLQKNMFKLLGMPSAIWKLLNWPKLTTQTQRQVH